MEMCIYCFYDKCFPLFATCVFSCMLCLLLAEWREHGKKSNIQTVIKLVLWKKKCLHMQSPVCVQGNQVIVHIINSLYKWLPNFHGCFWILVYIVEVHTISRCRHYSRESGWPGRCCQYTCYSALHTAGAEQNTLCTKHFSQSMITS